MEISVLSRQMAAYRSPGQPYALISITTPGDGQAELTRSELCRGVLRLEFHDIKEAHPQYRHFSDDDAEQIWAFVLEHRTDVQALVIHCDQGRSRSPAVAAAVARVLNGDDSRWWKGFRFNNLVYDTLLKAVPSGLVKPTDAVC